MELMRYENIETTMTFFVGRTAQAKADALWQAHFEHTSSSNAFGNIDRDLHAERLAGFGLILSL